MLTSLRIQNFRSIRDASVKLGQVNLFIGPNNSGKSNFLKGIEWMMRLIKERKNSSEVSSETFLSHLFRDTNLHEIMSLHWAEIAFLAKGNLNGSSFSLSVQTKNKSLESSADLPQNTQIASFVTLKDYKSPSLTLEVTGIISHYYTDVLIHKFEPNVFQVSAPIAVENTISGNGSNLIGFLFQLSQNNRLLFRQLESDLASCVGDLVAISTPADPNEPGKFKLRFFDQNNIGYWAEEVSEGVLYFLALLCIVHQPDPPKLLLLEEPEKGIHPRRIKEVMDFIFELAQLRGIQIILTSHSPYVVDHFADIPECVSVFDREGGETVIRNAADIIAETNDALAAAGQPPIRYSDGLGEYWVSGFLGGIPL